MIRAQRTRAVGGLQDQQQRRQLTVAPVCPQQIEAAPGLNVCRQDRRVRRAELDAQEWQAEANQQRQQRHQEQNGPNHHDMREPGPEAAAAGGTFGRGGERSDRQRIDARTHDAEDGGQQRECCQDADGDHQ